MTKSRRKKSRRKKSRRKKSRRRTRNMRGGEWRWPWSSWQSDAVTPWWRRPRTALHGAAARELARRARIERFNVQLGTADRTPIGPGCPARRGRPPGRARGPVSAAPRPRVVPPPIPCHPITNAELANLIAKYQLNTILPPPLCEPLTGRGTRI
jgi:hypothetical protein